MDTLIITGFCILFGPFLGIYLTKWLDKRAAKEDRRYSIFETLTLTKHSVRNLTQEHYDTLNKIALEFGGSNKRKDKEVIASRDLYFEHLRTAIENTEINAALWNKTSKECLNNLLFYISKALGQKTIKSQIQKDIYYPSAYIRQIAMQNRQSEKMEELLDTLLKNEGLPIRIINEKIKEVPNDPNPSP